MPDFSANGFCTAMNLLGGLIFGYGCIGINGALVKLYPCMLGLLPEHENTWGIAMLISSVNLGGLLGSAVIAKLTRQFHPCTIIVAGCAFCACALLGMFTSSYAVHFASRLLTGVGIGIICTVCPAYVVEICSPSHRGALGGLFQVSIALGIAVSAILSHFVMGSGRDLGADDFCRLMSTNGSAIEESLTGLKLILILPVCFPVVQGMVCLWRKFFSQSEASLQGRCHSSVVHFPETSLRFQRCDEKPLSTRKRLQQSRKGLIIAIVGAVALQLTGINAIWFYTFKFLVAAGITHKSVGSIVIMLINLSATLVATGISDRIGRRPPLVVGLLVMAISMTVLCFTGKCITATGADDDNIWRSALGFILLGMYIYGFSMGIGFNFWIVCNEVLPTPIYQVGFAIANILKWIFLISVTVLFPVVEKHMGSAVFVLFAIPAYMCSLFFYLCLPETKGLPKQLIADILEQRSWVLRDVQAKFGRRQFHY